MSRKLFTEEQQQLLRNNPYVYSVTASRLQLTKEFKELFMTAYNSGDSPRTILENYGFDIGIIGERRIWCISQYIRTEFQKYGEFCEGFGPRQHKRISGAPSNKPLTEQEEIQQLRHELDYLKQEMEFLKKIFSIRTTGK